MTCVDGKRPLPSGKLETAKRKTCHKGVQRRRRQERRTVDDQSPPHRRDEANSPFPLWERQMQAGERLLGLPPTCWRARGRRVTEARTRFYGVPEVTPWHKDGAQDKQQISCGTENIEEGKFCGQGNPSIQGDEEIFRDSKGDWEVQPQALTCRDDPQECWDKSCVWEACRQKPPRDWPLEGTKRGKGPRETQSGSHPRGGGTERPCGSQEKPQASC